MEKVNHALKKGKGTKMKRRKAIDIELESGSMRESGFRESGMRDGTLGGNQKEKEASWKEETSTCANPVTAWGQCGGIGYAGSTCCVSGYTCVYSSNWWSSCQPGNSQTTTNGATSTTGASSQTTPSSSATSRAGATSTSQSSTISAITSTSVVTQSSTSGGTSTSGATSQSSTSTGVTSTSSTTSSATSTSGNTSQSTTFASTTTFASSTTAPTTTTAAPTTTTAAPTTTTAAPTTTTAAPTTTTAAPTTTTAAPTTTTAAPTTTTAAPTTTTTAAPTTTTAAPTTTTAAPTTTTAAPTTTTAAPTTTTAAPTTTTAAPTTTTAAPTTTTAAPTTTTAAPTTTTAAPTTTTAARTTTTTKITTTSSTSTATNAPLVLTDAIRNQILADHNSARRTLATPVANNMYELLWDPKLEQTAQNYLVKSGCTTASFAHNSARTADYLALGGQNGGYVGENWYSGGPINSADFPSENVFGGATVEWTTGTCIGASFSGGVFTCSTHATCSEKDGFYGDKNGSPCNQENTEYGHFTQVMWAATQYVGCGYTSQCGTLCDYVQGGNVNLPTNPQPGDIWGFGGQAASKCPANAPTNDNGLCK
ncbi:hypothetical protein HDV01_000325 [Terramyces sp. JEL0728]|nr:hypothetical protein HDV01_000325 [Terramyces sp. JEL0728]